MARIARALVPSAVVIALLITTMADAKPPVFSDDLKELAARALSQDEEIAHAAIAALREAGPPGLDTFFQVHAERFEVARLPDRTDRYTQKQLPRPMIYDVADAIARQRDVHSSHLYWYTDMSDAVATARRLQRPILSLRLLGNLDEEFSCANSRFFRTVLYADSQVADVFRDRFVLHWESVRPAPKITIEFGDGRTLCRTITGNSIHYVLDYEGRPVDGIPGLYSGAAFLRALKNAELMAHAASAASTTERAGMLRRYHRTRYQDVLKRWNADLRAVDHTIAAEPSPLPVSSSAQLKNQADRNEAVPAALAAPIARTKMRVESPLVAAMVPDASALEKTTDDVVWQKLAAIHQPYAVLSTGSRALLYAKTPAAVYLVSQASVAKHDAERPLLKLVRTFEQSLALDTVRNEYLYHRAIHEWFATGSAPSDVHALNERVYAELFLTPSSDPWLGLLPPNTYSALDDDGIEMCDR